ncbi:nucleotide disphospho-sugar-binding domain-containing protein [Saccharopolyspora shandongensis]|uniref:glycosyltransferase n=1 Tax=Saccharopolyspora shandongensis TaxID=418495 RepID=UPI0033DE4943
MKVLVMTYSAAYAAGDHLMVMVPLCGALRAAGHEVLLACPPEFAPIARSVAINTICVGESRAPVEAEEQPQEETRDANPSLLSFPLSACGRRESEVGRRIWEFTASNALHFAFPHFEEYVRAGHDWGAELVIHDPFAALASLVGAVLGIPAVAHRWGVDPTTGPFAERTRELLQVPAWFAGLPDAPSPALVLDPCPPSLQAPEAPPGHLVRYVPNHGSGVLPQWALRRPAKPRICIALSPSLGDRNPGLFDRVVAAVSGLAGAEVIVAGPGDREHPGVDVFEPAPLPLFLSATDLLVHDGASKAGLTAAALGVPQLVLPQMAEQFDYGRALAKQGAGISLSTAEEQEDVALVRSSAAAVLDVSGYRVAAHDLRAEIESVPPPADAVPVLEALVARGR